MRLLEGNREAPGFAGWPAGSKWQKAVADGMILRRSPATYSMYLLGSYLLFTALRMDESTDSVHIRYRDSYTVVWLAGKQGSKGGLSYTSRGQTPLLGIGRRSLLPRGNNSRTRGRYDLSAFTLIRYSYCIHNIYVLYKKNVYTYSYQVSLGRLYLLQIGVEKYVRSHWNT